MPIYSLQITLTDSVDTANQVELLPVFFGDQSSPLYQQLPQPMMDAYRAKRDAVDLDSPAEHHYQLLPTYGNLSSTDVLIAEFRGGDVRRLGHDLIKYAQREKQQGLLIDLRGLVHPVEVRSLVEGLCLANYKRQTYRQKEKQKTFPERVELVLDGADLAKSTSIEQDIKEAQIYAEAVCLARDLTNLPGNELVPASLAQIVHETAARFEGLDCEILTEQEIVEKGMGGLYSVGKGSVNPPRMITVQYHGNPESEETLGIIGKGITFDTGGISLKRSDNMAEMICDMAGAATVVALIQAIGQLRPKCNLLFVIASAENMPAGNAYKPGDIVTTLSGKTIEVLNTDAEGRVVLADAVTYAKQLGATRLIDLATLTGAVLVSLADVATGAVTNNQLFMDDFRAACERSEERVWQFPVYPEYKEMIKSKVADVKNTGGRYAGSITGGLFIGTFAEKTPWIHLDIAGTAFLDKQRGIHPAGGTGVMVRALLDFIQHSCARI